MRYGNSLLVAALLLCYAVGLQAQDTDENRLWPLIDRPDQTDATCLKLFQLNLQARGGLEAMTAASNVRFEGVYIEGKSDYVLASLHAHPNRIRREVSRRHIGRDYLNTEGSSGTDFWRQIVLPEKQLPRKVGGLDAQLLDLEARIPYLFMDEAIQGATFAYMGEVRYANRPAYLVHGWLPSGLEIDVHLDAKSFHVINYRHPMRIGGDTVLVDRTPVGLQRAGDVWWERGHKIHIRAKVMKEFTSEEIAVNVDLGEAAFLEPATSEYWLRP